MIPKQQMQVAAAAIATLCVVLTACTSTAPQSANSPATSPSPGAVTSGPTAAPTLAAKPSPRFDVGCDAVVSPDTARTTLGPQVHEILQWPDESGAGQITESFSIAMHVAVVQTGSLVCQWGIGNYAALYVTAVPDAAEEFSALVPTLYGLPKATMSGGTAYGSCSDGGVPSCDYQALIGSTWLSILQGPLDGVAMSSAEFATIVDSAIGAIRGATIDRAWTPQQMAWMPPEHCDALGASLGGTAVPLAPSGFADYQEAAAVEVSGGLGCVISVETNTIQVVAIAGGAWSWDSMAPTSNSSLSLTAISDLGDDASVGCSDRECVAHVISGGNRLAVYASSAKPADMVHLVKSILSALSR
jgi:hypothetical protein